MGVISTYNNVEDFAKLLNLIFIASTMTKMLKEMTCQKIVFQKIFNFNLETIMTCNIMI